MRVQQHSFTFNQYVSTWLEIGKCNPWIKHAYDPAFTLECFYECSDREELKEKICGMGWCIGQAFTLGNLCFIQQVEGGDEWLAIKENTAFDSWSIDRMIQSGSFDDYLNRVEKASKEQLKQLTY